MPLMPLLGFFLLIIVPFGQEKPEAEDAQKGYQHYQVGDAFRVQQKTMQRIKDWMHLSVLSGVHIRVNVFLYNPDVRIESASGLR